MATKNMMYDHPAYQAVYHLPLWGGVGVSTLSSSVAAVITGASAQSTKFVAFTNMLIKSITASASTIGTSSVASNNGLFFRVTNNGTTAVNTVTATYTLVPTGVPGPAGVAVTTAAYVVNHIGGTGISTSAATVNALGGATGIPLLQGDIGYFQKGTDATEQVLAIAECLIQPLSNVTL
jgi:hypothetical protein